MEQSVSPRISESNGYNRFLPHQDASINLKERKRREEKDAVQPFH
jgi:hypothetical protein